MTAEDGLNKVVNLLKDAADPEKIILFGSRVTGEAKADSDFDIMVVIKEKPASRVKEATRLRRLIAPLHLDVDLLLVTEEKFDYWKETVNTVYFDAETEGTVLYAKAA